MQQAKEPSAGAGGVSGFIPLAPRLFARRCSMPICRLHPVEFRSVPASIRAEFLEMLRCPENGSKLELADVVLLESLNAAIAARRLKNRAGQAIEKPLSAALVRADRQLVYKVDHEIPILLIDEAIPLDQLAAHSPSG